MLAFLNSAFGGSEGGGDEELAKISLYCGNFPGVFLSADRACPVQQRRF